jgi:hypothetical protein
LTFTNRAGRLVERRAALDPDRLGDGDLHVVDELAVPDRLEDPVREAKREHVLHRLLAQVVVDAKDLALVEVAVKLVVEPARARPVGAEGLLDDQARPALPVAAPAADLLDEDRDRAGRDREVEDAVALGAELLVEPREEGDQRILALVGCEVGRDVVHPPGEPLPDLLVDRVPAEVAHGVLHPRPEVGVGLLRAGDADDRELVGHEVADGQRVDRGKELPPGQVARSAEDDDRARVWRAREVEALRERVLHFAASSAALTAWPPNCWRRAAFTFAANDSSWREAKRANSASVIAGAGTLSSIALNTVQRPSPESST